MASGGRVLSSGSRILGNFRQIETLKSGASSVGVQRLRHLHTAKPCNSNVLPKAQYGGRHTVTLLTGDGVGPELLAHVKQMFRYAAVPVDFEELTLNRESTDAEYNNAILAVKRNGVAIKGNIETSSERYADLSRNVEIRAELDLFANIVHCKSIPGIPSLHTGIDLVIFRENTEGEYSSLEHESVSGVVESLKIITEMKSRRIAEMAFNYASRHGRKKVTAVHKANIMKLADGLFLESCRKVSENYPGIEFEGMIVDNASMQLVSRPQQFDVMVLPNLYGNVIANIAAGLVGGPGVTSGSNVGHEYAIFETGTRNTGKGIAGKNIANPSGMLLASADMLAHLGLFDHAQLIRETVAEVLTEDKVHTPDIGGKNTSADFMEAMVARLQAQNKWY